MPRKPFPQDIIKQAREVASAWRQINPTMFFGPVSATALKENINASSTLQAQISVLEIQLAELRNQHDASNKKLWEKVKRVRAGIKETYGHNSQQFKMMGGTPTGERKSPTPKRVKK